MILKLSPITLRDTISVNYKTAYSFHRILLKTDLPYTFDQIKKYWWRWYSEFYGFFYNRVKRSYSIWLTMSLKQNLGVYMSFFMKMPGERSKILDKWSRKAYLYQNSLISRQPLSWDYQYFTKVSFEFPRSLLLSEAANHILLPNNRSHRPLGSFGRYDWELDMFVSSYNGKWNNLYTPESQFYNISIGRMPKSFLIAVNSSFFNSGFFINSFDSLLMLYPQYFLEYHNRLYSKNILNLFKYFRMSFNYFFYSNILILLFKIFSSLLNKKLQAFMELNVLNNNYFILYKINLYIYFIKYINKIYFTKYVSYLDYFISLRSLTLNTLTLNILSFFFSEKNLYLSIYIKYKSQILLNWKNIIKNKYLNIYYKYLNTINYKNQLFVEKMINLNKIKKFSNTKLFKLWNIFNLLKKRNFTSINENLSDKKYSKFLFSKISNYFVDKKFRTYLGINNLIKFLNQIIQKDSKKNIQYNRFNFIKPSRIKLNLPIRGIVTWITKFNKHFVKLPKYLLNLKSTTGFYYTTSSNTFRIYLYKSYKGQLRRKLLTFTNDIFNLILFSFKTNFGLSYNLFLNLFKRKTANLIDNYYAFNLQSKIFTFLNFIKKYFNKLTYVKNFIGISVRKKLKINERLFLSLINIGTLRLLTNSLYKLKTIKFIHNYKGLFIKKFTYWSFTLGL